MKKFYKKNVTIDNDLKAILVEPELGTAPLVLMLHGFGSNKDEVGNLFKNIAFNLAEKEISSLRIDFSGFGESEKRSLDTTINSLLEDATKAFEYLMTLPSIENKPIGVLGFSLGGAIGILLSAKQQEKIKALALWSSVDDFEKVFIKTFSIEAFEEAKKVGLVELDLGWRKVVLSNNFFESLKNFDLKEALKKIKTPFLSIRGEKDPIAPDHNLFNNLVTSKKKELLSFEKADHIFGVLNKEENFSKELIEKTTLWFSEILN